MSSIESFTNDGLTFTVRDSGPEDGPAVVLLHGFLQTSRAWTAVSDILDAHGLRTVAPDLRGYAAQARPRGRLQYRSSKLVGDVRALIGTLGAGPVHLVGHDWGALLAWSTASSHPELVQSLTTVSVPHYAAFLRSVMTPDQLRRSYYIGLFQVPLVPELLFEPSRRILTRALAASGMTTGSIEAVHRDIVGSGALPTALNWYRGLPFSDQRAMLRPTPVDTTFVWGDADTIIGRRGVDLTAPYVTGRYRLCVLPGVGHWIPDEAPQALAEAILSAAG